MRDPLSIMQEKEAMMKVTVTPCNPEGYPDPTAYKAITNTDRHEDRDLERFRRLLGHIFYVTDMAGFHIENRIEIKDLRTGKVYK